MVTKKYIKIVGIVIILLIIIISAIIYIVKTIEEEEYDNTIIADEYPSDEETVYVANKIERVSIRNNYYMIETCVNKYFEYINQYNNSENDYEIIDEDVENTIIEYESEMLDGIYSMLSTEYIEYANITNENLSEKIISDNDYIIMIDDMYYIAKDENIETYFVYGQKIDKINTIVEDFKIMLQLDKVNDTFEIYLEDYINENYPNIEVGQELVINMPDTIENKTVNITSYENITDEEHILDIFADLKINLLYNKESVYNDLEGEYSKEKFSNYEEFEEYASNNVKKNVIMTLSEYEKTVEDEYTEYLCQDTNGNYYIIRETSVKDYSIMFDIYTIDVAVFVEKYEELDDDQKALYCIERIKTAINYKDYGYVYSKLDETFKTTNFENEEALENFIIENWSSEIEVEYTTVEETSGMYVIQAKITTENGDTITTQFIVQLLDGTDFIMSFNI